MENEEIQNDELNFDNRIPLEDLKESVESLKSQLSKIIIGQEEFIELLIVSLLANGHVLIEGVPGVAKTITAKLFAHTLKTDFSRVQFTPDLMPSDVLGTSVFNGKTAAFKFKKGHFTREGKLPRVSSNVTLIKGWFDETLPNFVDSSDKSIKIIHIDGDTYEAAKIVLEHTGSKLIRGSIIIFDEYFGYLGWKNGEYKAFQEFISEKKIDYKYLAFTENSVAIEIG